MTFWVRFRDSVLDLLWNKKIKQLINNTQKQHKLEWTGFKTYKFIESILEILVENIFN